MEQCGIKNPRSAWSPTVGMTNVIYHRGREEIPSDVKDCVFSLYYKNLGRIGHVGFVESKTNGGFITVEGNTNGKGEREGDGVHRKKRLDWEIFTLCRYN